MQVGELLQNRYRVKRFVDHGSMGAVYEAFDESLNRAVAIKVIQAAPASEASQAAMQEARAIAALSHPNIVKIFDVVAHGNGIFLISEWLDAGALNVIQRPLHPAAILAIAVQMFEALEAIHARALVHRDIKPSNVLLTKDGRVVVIDFGVAFSAAATNAGMTLAGTIKYTSPAVLAGRAASAQSDYYSAGLVLLELTQQDAVIPDLAPVALYEYTQKELPKKLREIVGGIYSPLAWVIQKLLKADSLGGSLDAHQKLLHILHESLREITALNPQ